MPPTSRDFSDARTPYPCSRPPFRGSRSETVQKRATITWPIALGLFVAVVAIFLPVLRNDFVDWDDDLNLTGNLAYRGFSTAHLRWMFTTTLGGHYQPLSWLSFALDHALWAMDPRGYHLTGLLLHAANAVLAFVVIRALLERLELAPAAIVTRAAAAGALFFAIHPLRVESVAWASERRDVLSGLFWLLAIAAYLRAASTPAAHRPRLLRLALAALVASLLAKAWGITFPLVLLILDAYPLRRWGEDRSALLREKIPFAVAAATGAVIAFAAQQRVPEMRSLAEHGLLARVAQAAYGLSFYLVETVWPVGLHPAYLLEADLDPTRPRYLVAFVLVVTATAAAIAGRRRWPGLAAAWAAYVVILAPVLGLAQTGPQLVADRYTYLACLPWVVVLAGGLAHSWSRERPLPRRLGTAATAAALALLAALTVRQVGVWKDSQTLWNHTLALDPDNWVAFTNRGFARRDRAEAIADYGAAIRANPRYRPAWLNRGNARLEQGDAAGAVADHSQAIVLAPTDPEAYNNRGWARQTLGDWAGAVEDYTRALELAPASWPHHDLVMGNLAAARARIVANGG